MLRIKTWLACVVLLLALGGVANAQVVPFPFGVYDKDETTPGSAEWAAHYRALFEVLADNNINTILTLPYRAPEHTLAVLDEALRHRVRAIMGTGNPLNGQWDYAKPGYPFFRAYTHRAVFAYKYGDEPDGPEDIDVLANPYAMLRTYLRRPVVTALVGENMDFAADSFPHRMWERLDADVRFARHYPLRRTYDLVNWYRDKMKLPFDEWARQMEQSESTAWWCVLQTFGRGIDASEASFWRFPTAAELRAMMHIAVANGARGIIGYALQDHDRHLQGLVDAQLQPRTARDGTVPLLEYRRFGAYVQQHAELLARHKRAQFGATADRPELVVVPRFDPKSDEQYVYVVNKNAAAAVAARIRIETHATAASEVYTGASGELVAQTAGFADLGVQLQPGEGQFWLLHK